MISQVKCIGFGEEEANRVAQNLVNIIYKFNFLDLDGLDHLIIGRSLKDYHNGLKEFNSDLTATTENGTGIAMSLPIFDKGKLIGYTVAFCAEAVLIPLLDGFETLSKENKDYEDIIDLMIQTIAHELCHVHVGEYYFKIFSDVLGKRSFRNKLDSIRGNTLLRCLDEFKVCSLCCGYGQDPEPGYATLLEDSLTAIDGNISKVKNNIIYGDWGGLCDGIFKYLSQIFVFSSYCIGTSLGKNIKITDSLGFKVVRETWFEPYFLELNKILLEFNNDLEANLDVYSIDKYQKIGDLLQEVGIYFRIKVQEAGENTYVELLS